MDNFKKMVFLATMLCTSTVVLAAKPQMPKQFLGNWAQSKASCTIPKDSPIDYPESGAKIKSDGIERYEYWCGLTSITKSTKQSITANFTCSSEGEEEAKKHTLSISTEGKLLGLSETALVRCKSR